MFTNTPKCYRTCPIWARHHHLRVVFSCCTTCYSTCTAPCSVASYHHHHAAQLVRAARQHAWQRDQWLDALSNRWVITPRHHNFGQKASEFSRTAQACIRDSCTQHNGSHCAQVTCAPINLPANTRCAAIPCNYCTLNCIPGDLQPRTACSKLPAPAMAVDACRPNCKHHAQFTRKHIHTKAPT